MTQGQEKSCCYKVNFFMDLLINTAKELEKKALSYQPASEREKTLLEISRYVGQSLNAKQKAQVIFICTHNSRRSHFCALLLELAKDYYHIENLQTFSGGSKPTLFHPMTKNTLEKIGFVFIQKEISENPKYLVKNLKSINLHFSKNYQDPVNPKKNFAAILVCSSAEKECPVVFGQDKRFYLPYEDPALYDNTNQAEEAYLNIALTIGMEMFWLAQKVVHYRNTASKVH